MQPTPARRQSHLPLLTMCATLTLGLGSSISASNGSNVPWNEQVDCRAETSLLLHQAGLSPESLATVGAFPTQVDSIVAVARSLCEGSGAFLSSNMDQIEALRSAITELEDLVQQGRASANDYNVLAASRSNLAAAESSRLTVVSTLMQSVQAQLAPEQFAMLQNIIAVGDVGVPSYEKVVYREQAGWVTLRNALSEYRRLEDLGGSPTLPEPPIDVLIAQYLHDVSITGVEQAWVSAFAE